jgi:hypothetical protein
VLAALAALGCLLPSCATIPQSPVIGRLPEPEFVVERLEARRLDVRSFQLQGQVDIESRGEELLGDHLIVGQYPDSLRADILGPFGRPQMSLALKGGELTVLVFSENRAFRGPASPNNLGRFLGVGLDAAALYDLLTGSPPLIKFKQAQLVTTADSAVAQLKLVDDSGSLGQVVEVHLGDYTVNQTWLRSMDGPTRLSCVYDNFRATSLGRYPSRIELSDNQQRRVSLINDDIKLNPLVDQSLFELSVPTAMPLEPLP